MDISSETDMTIELSDDASEVSDLVADERDEFYHEDDQDDEVDIDSEAEENDELDHVDDNNDEADIDPVAEEQEEFDNTDDIDDENVDIVAEKDDFELIDEQRDEVNLNPIEETHVLERILDIQDTGCCDMAVENSMKKMDIPEEVIERFLCRAEKEIFTCETTAFVEKVTGLNICVADVHSSIAIEDGDSSNLDIALVKNEIVADDEKTAASTDLDTTAESCDSAHSNVNTSSFVESDEKSNASSMEALSEVSKSMMEEEDEDDKDDNEGFECRLASNSWSKKKAQTNEIMTFRPKRTSRFSKLLSKMKTARSSNTSPRREPEEEVRSVGDEELKLGSHEVVVEISV